MASKLTGEALNSRVKGIVDGQDVRIQGKGSLARRAFKKLAVTVAAVAVFGLGAAPAQAGFFDDIVNKTKQNVERTVERSVERGVQEAVRGTVGKQVKKGEQSVRKGTKGIVRSNDGTRAINGAVNKFKKKFKIKF